MAKLGAGLDIQGVGKISDSNTLISKLVQQAFAGLTEGQLTDIDPDVLELLNSISSEKGKSSVEFVPMSQGAMGLPGVKVGSPGGASSSSSSDAMALLQNMISANTNKIANMVKEANKSSYKGNVGGVAFDNSLIVPDSSMSMDTWERMQSLVNEMKASTLSQMNSDAAVRLLMEQLADKNNIDTEALVENMAKELLGLKLPDSSSLKGSALEAINAASSNALRQINAQASRGGVVGSTGIARLLSSTLVNAASQAAKAGADIDRQSAIDAVQYKTAIAQAVTSLTKEAKSWRKELVSQISNILGGRGQTILSIGG